MSQTQYSHSRVSTYEQCPAQFKLRYIDELKTIRDPWPDDALIVGNALHHGIEHGEQSMIRWYYDQFPLIGDGHINEAIKLRTMLPKVLDFLNTLDGEFIHEYEINRPDFKGFVDLIVRNPDGTVDVYDFKYSNNVDKYLKSAQPHLYKFYLEREKFKVSRIGFVFIPKTSIRQKKTEELYHFRRRLKETLDGMQVDVRYVDYDFGKVKQFWDSCREIEAASEYPKNKSRLCDWCEFQKYCHEGIDYMILPKNERRPVTINTTPDMWLYGDSYSGKTVFMDSFDDVLMINTDGNIDHISSPVVRIMDTVKVEGRLTTRIFAWKNFLDVIAELEKKQNDFKTVVVDLVEDLWEHCRLYMYDKLGIEHEHDAGYGKGYDMVRTEFLSNMKRLKNCGYQLVYISKLAVSEITQKNGAKITTFKPNINDKVANVLAGTVDLTAMVVADGDERYLNLKTSPYIFGGTRYNFGVDRIPLNRDEFIRTLTAAQKGKAAAKVETAASEKTETEMTTNDAVRDSAPVDNQQSEVDEQASRPRRRRA